LLIAIKKANFKRFEKYLKTYVGKTQDFNNFKYQIALKFEKIDEEGHIQDVFHSSKILPLEQAFDDIISKIKGIN